MTEEQAQRGAKEIIKHGGNCSEADLTCYTCPIRPECLKGRLAGKNRTDLHQNRKLAAEKFLKEGK